MKPVSTMRCARTPVPDPPLKIALAEVDVMGFSIGEEIRE
jgi:hypothetical protein